LSERRAIALPSRHLETGFKGGIEVAKKKDKKKGKKKKK
jgi:hypothetical protein